MWIFVFIETDAGITGIGEATTEYQELAVVAAIEQHFAPVLIGKDPREIERICQMRYRLNGWRQGVVMSSAMSGIDQALWDICRQSLRPTGLSTAGRPLPRTRAALCPWRPGSAHHGRRGARDDRRDRAAPLSAAQDPSIFVDDALQASNDQWLPGFQGEETRYYFEQIPATLTATGFLTGAA